MPTRSAHRGCAVITGANRGLGLLVAKALAEAGHSIIAVARTDTGATEAVAALPSSSGRHVPLALDLASLQSDAAIQQAADRILHAAGGTIELLINNAGVFIDRWDQAAWEETRVVNFAAPVGLTRLLLPSISADGLVVMVSASGYGRLSELSSTYRARVSGASTFAELSAIAFDAADHDMGSRYAAPYKLSKAMLNRATQLLAQESERAERRVSVCAVGPGWCRTRMGGDGAPRSAEQGAASILWTTSHRGPCNGRFLVDGEPVDW